MTEGLPGSGVPDYNMATMENFGQIPLRFPDVEQYFMRLQFYLIAKGKVDV